MTFRTKQEQEEYEALEMAIKALSQEPTDAISREDAIKALQKVACYSAAIRARMIGAIEDLPPVTQEYTVFHCPKCGYQDAREL